jgi:hypothetical protein
MGGHVGYGFQLGQFPWRGFSDMEQRLPQAIIVGIRKCGTRALLEFLSLHPDICHAHDEMHFFDRDERYSLGLEWYRKQMPLSHPNQITIEKTPGYFITRRVPSLINDMNQDIKLLIIVRDPVTRIISDYTQSYANHVKRNMTYTPLEVKVTSVTLFNLVLEGRRLSMPVCMRVRARAKMRTCACPQIYKFDNY